MSANTSYAVFSSLAHMPDSSMLYSPSMENGYYERRETPREKKRKKRSVANQAKRDASKVARAMRRKQKMR